ncbi:suppressor of fused domain protein [Kitasatospora sp. NBC_01287]|uniref:suppressor of fused domain protein n=1 Tax=Kitasatospora sp. NBC_01287 TaxID=2903573 RepID=UPI00224DD4C9|nr:suppressor of fused domain protein [Kitasatospora sp. NBC_01287]MCX4746903.1 suppressor of fused domain protein [Kitasatospora sp. NBC_01287]
MAHDFPLSGDTGQPHGPLGPTRGEVLAAVEARLLTTFGEPSGRAAITFLGAERIEVLRFGPDAEGLVRYATLGMAAAPMADPTAAIADPVRGPRAELLLTLRGARDDVLRALATFAATPQVEGLVVAPGSSLDLGGPLWAGAAFTSVLAGEGGTGVVADLELDEPADPVVFLPLLPMTPNEAAHKRVRGAAALRERWLEAGTDLRDPQRRGVALD